jgi:hypothetical protein
MIKMAEGLERLMILVSGLREYRCQECDQKFRALDRRKERRKASSPIAETPAPHRQAA